jgi:hypothetical protein
MHNLILSITKGSAIFGSVLQGYGSSKNDSGSSLSGGAVFLVKLKPFWKTFGKTASPIFHGWIKEVICPICP